ncbi:hypothetical protein HHI36_009927, partial [Cryptolaemus montrouzieri]
MRHAFLTKSGLDVSAEKEAAKSVEGHFLVADSSVELELLSSSLMYTYQRAIHGNPIIGIGTTFSEETVAGNYSLMAKYKHRKNWGCRGRWIDGHWVIGVVDEVGNFRCDVVDAHDTEILHRWIVENVHSGSNLPLMPGL